MPKTRPCKGCGRNRAEDEFYKTHRGRPRGTCKSCDIARAMDRYRADPEAWKKRTVAAERKRLYGVGAEQYETMLREQGGCCVICGSDGGGRQLCVDHDHATGVVRQLLCYRCNTAIGWLDDDPARALAAAEYLEKHGGEATPLRELRSA